MNREPDIYGKFAQRYAFHRQHHTPFHAFMSAVAIGQLLLVCCVVGVLIGYCL